MLNWVSERPSSRGRARRGFKNDGLEFFGSFGKCLEIVIRIVNMDYRKCGGATKSLIWKPRLGMSGNAKPIARDAAVIPSSLSSVNLGYRQVSCYDLDRFVPPGLSFASIR